MHVRPAAGVSEASGLGAAGAPGEEQGGGGGERDGRGTAQGTIHEGESRFDRERERPSLPVPALDCLRLRIPPDQGDNGHMGDTTTVPDFAGEFADAADSLAESRRGALESDLDGGGVALASAVRRARCSTRAAATGHPLCRPPSSWASAGSSTRSTWPSRCIERARERAGERMPQLRLHVADVDRVGAHRATTSCSACWASTSSPTSRPAPGT